jgi:hypothetical protein
MPFDLTPSVNVRRDEQEHVRQLEHAEQPFAPTAEEVGVLGVGLGGPLKPVADAYLREVGPLFEIGGAELAALDQRAEAAPVPQGRELRFKEEKSQGGAGVVAYEQTHFGLPIHESGVSVVLDAVQRTVIGSSNQIDYEADPPQPNPEAPYRQEKIDAAALGRLLGSETRPVINATRELIYRYEKAERLDPQTRAHENPNHSTGFAGVNSPAFPNLRGLPPVAASIVNGHTYIVTEELFTLPDDRGAILNWQSYIEIETGSVLYLRPLVACASGLHFAGDPATTSGTALSGSSPAAALNAQRMPVTLQDLKPPLSGVQFLDGSTISLVDIEPPTVAMPNRTAPFGFDFATDTDDFAACCAYHNCRTVFAFIQGIGVNLSTYFDGTTFPVPVDPHALGARINAEARGNALRTGLGSLVFGRASSTTGVGIAADARVVWHEFGHALLWDHVGSPNFGFAHSAGDTLGALYYDATS